MNFMVVRVSISKTEMAGIFVEIKTSNEIHPKNSKYRVSRAAYQSKYYLTRDVKNFTISVYLNVDQTYVIFVSLLLCY